MRKCKNSKVNDTRFIVVRSITRPTSTPQRHPLSIALIPIVTLLLHPQQGGEAFTTHSFHHSPVRQRTVVLLHNSQCWQRTVRPFTLSPVLAENRPSFHTIPVWAENPSVLSHSPSVGREPFRPFTLS